MLEEVATELRRAQDNVRDASVGLVAPRIRKDLNIPEATQQAARATLTRALEALDTGWLQQSRHLAGDVITSYSIHYTKLYEQ